MRPWVTEIWSTRGNNQGRRESCSLQNPKRERLTWRRLLAHLKRGAFCLALANSGSSMAKMTIMPNAEVTKPPIAKPVPVITPALPLICLNAMIPKIIPSSAGSPKYKERMPHTSEAMARPEVLGWVGIP